MRKIIPPVIIASLHTLFFAYQAMAANHDQILQIKLAKTAPSLDRKILEQAITATRCAADKGVIEYPQRLAVIDYSLPSSEKRLWIFDLSSGSLLLNELVAHGRQSGNKLSTRFSNKPGSHKSSLGLFAGSESYSGRHGYSLRLDGLENDINHNARDRAIVIHGADY